MVVRCCISRLCTISPHAYAQALMKAIPGCWCYVHLHDAQDISALHSAAPLLFLQGDHVQDGEPLRHAMLECLHPLFSYRSNAHVQTCGHHTCSQRLTVLWRDGGRLGSREPAPHAATAGVGAGARAAGCTCGYTFCESRRPHVQVALTVCI